MKRPFLERVFVVLWLFCGSVAAVNALIGITGLYKIISQPMNNTADPWAGFKVISPDPWAGFEVIFDPWAEFRQREPAPAPATIREALPPLPPGFTLKAPGFDAEGARRAGYSETEIVAFLSQNRKSGDIAVNDAGHVMIFRQGAWSRAPIAQNDQGARLFFDGTDWKDAPGQAVPQLGYGERVVRVVRQVDAGLVFLLLIAPPLFAAFISVFQYLLLGFFSPLTLFRSGK